MFSPCLFDPYFIISPASYTESITVIIWTIYILQIIFSKQSTLNISVFCCCPIRRKEKITVVWCNVRYGCPTIADVPLPHLHQSNFSKLVIRICFHNAKFVFLVELQFSLLFWPLRHLFLPPPFLFDPPCCPWSPVNSAGSHVWRYTTKMSWIP